MKKLVSLMLVMVFMLGVCTVSIMAQNDSDVAIIDGKEYNVGDTIIYTTYLKSTDLLAAINFSVDFTNEILEYNPQFAQEVETDSSKAMPVLNEKNASVVYNLNSMSSGVQKFRANMIDIQEDKAANFNSDNKVLVMLYFDVIESGSASITTNIEHIYKWQDPYSTQDYQTAQYTMNSVVTKDELIHTVKFVNEDNEVLDTQYIVDGQNASLPVVPLMRESVYVPQFTIEDTKNITSNKTFIFNKEVKTFTVDSTDSDVVITDEDGYVKDSFYYEEIVDLKYTGDENFTAWKINGKIVSTKEDYAFFVLEDSMVEVVVNNEETIQTGIFVSNDVILDTTAQADRIYMYYNINATNVPLPLEEQDLKYGVYRTTTAFTKEDAQTKIQSYLNNGSSANIKEYTQLDVLNDEGRYNYLLSVPTTISKDATVYMSAWIEIDGILYVSDVSAVKPAKAFE